VQTTLGGVMARYVLLSFENNEEADKFVQAVTHEKPFTFKAPTPEGRYTMATAKGDVFVRGVFMQPTKFCDCLLAKDGEFGRGQKWGMFVHKKCGKPRAGQFQHPNNLIEPVTGPRERSLYLGIEEPLPDRAKAKLPPTTLDVIEPLPKDQTPHFVGVPKSGQPGEA
jgi:hypothetical protein